MRILEEQSKLVQSDPKQAAFALVKKDFDNRLKAFQKRSDALSEQVRHMFAFCDTVFPNGQEQLILVTELTANRIVQDFWVNTRSMRILSTIRN